MAGEASMDLLGSFEIRRGPNTGETRKIDCWSYRDHTWSDRLAIAAQWKA
jgi:hypothetical protein